MENKKMQNIARIGLSIELSIALLVFVIAVGYALINPMLSPIDEYMHFDYAEQIALNNHLPSFFDKLDIRAAQDSEVSFQNIPFMGTLQFETTQPPLYYVAASFVLRFFDDIKSRIIAIRILGGVFLAFSAYLTMKFFNMTRSMTGLETGSKQIWLDASIVALFFLLPGVLVRVTTASNDSLLLPLMTILLGALFIHSNEWEDNKISSGEKRFPYSPALVMGLFLAASILTKYTPAYMFALICFVYLIRNINNPALFTKETFVFCCLTGLLVFPWFFYNYVEYGELTTTNFHVNYILPVVNPMHVDLTFLQALSWTDNVVMTFWFPQEWIRSVFSTYAITVIHFLTSVLVLFAMVFVGEFVSDMFNQKSIVAVRTSRNFPFVILALSIFLNLVSLIWGTITTEIGVMLGRYLYINLLSFALIYRAGIHQMINSKYQVLLTALNIFVVIFLNYEYLRGIL